MRIAPRALLCGTTFRVSGLNEAGFDELRELSTAADDKVSLAMAMAGHVLALAFRGRYRKSSALASQLVGLIESIGDPALTVALICMAIVPKLMTGETGEVVRRSPIPNIAKAPVGSIACCKQHSEPISRGKT